ncbi:NAD-binding protein [Treponema saccharophilum]|nr:NAD-binding protein [Treponema saccharophilum]
MKIVIIGAGFTGIELAKRLVNGKNDVVLIDNDKDAVLYAENRLDCGAILADGNNLSTLEDAGIANADALVCVTSNDEVNMITCSLVDSVYPDVLKIARVRNYAYYANTAEATMKHSSDARKHRPLYGIDFMVNPDFEAAQAIVNSIEKNSITDSLQFDNSPYEIVRISVEAGSRFDGNALKDLWRLTDKRILVSYIERDGVTSLPYGETIVRSGDVLGILLEHKFLGELLTLCGSKLKNIQKIALVGAGKIGTIVAEKLGEKRRAESKFFRRRGANFVIIENDAERAAAAEEKFNKIAKVFRADVTEEEFIEEEHLGEFDLLICSTSNYEMNIVTAAYIESLGVENSIVLVPSDAYGGIAHRLGIEVAVPVRDTVVDSIMSHLRGSSVTGIHTVNGGFLEIAEVTVAEGSAVDGKMLMEISDPGRFLILMGHKSGEEAYSILGGKSVLNAGDKVVVIAPKKDSTAVLERFS